jgi:hypothetical protein
MEYREHQKFSDDYEEDEFPKRQSLHVPSLYCQSLLGKAVLEHFTSESEIAAVFSSSSSLQNSSAGANLASNFHVDENTFRLFTTVFAPPTCFSVQFVPAWSVIRCSMSFSSKIRYEITDLLSDLAKTPYARESLRWLDLRALDVTSALLEQIVSDFPRIETLILSRPKQNVSLTSLQKLPDLKRVKISLYGNASSDAILVLSKLRALTSLTLDDEYKAPAAASDHHLASLRNLDGLSMSLINFSNENLLQLSSLPHLRKLRISQCGGLDVSKMVDVLATMENLTSLDISYFSYRITNDHIKRLAPLEDLEEFFLRDDSITNAMVGLITKQFRKLKKLELNHCRSLNDESLHHLRSLRQLESLVLPYAMYFTVRILHQFLMTRPPTLKEVRCGWFEYDRNSLIYVNAATKIMNDARRAQLNWHKDIEISSNHFHLLFELMGKERCEAVKEVKARFCFHPQKAEMLTTYSDLGRDPKYKAGVAAKNVGVFPTHLPNLQKLTLFNEKKFTSKELKKMKRNLPTFDLIPSSNLHRRTFVLKGEKNIDCSSDNDDNEEEREFSDDGEQEAMFGFDNFDDFDDFDSVDEETEKEEYYYDDVFEEDYEIDDDDEISEEEEETDHAKKTTAVSVNSSHPLPNIVGVAKVKVEVKQEVVESEGQDDKELISSGTRRTRGGRAVKQSPAPKKQNKTTTATTTKKKTVSTTKKKTTVTKKKATTSAKNKKATTKKATTKKATAKTSTTAKKNKKKQTQVKKAKKAAPKKSTKKPAAEKPTPKKSAKKPSAKKSQPKNKNKKK